MNLNPVLTLLAQSAHESWPLASKEAFFNSIRNKEAFLDTAESSERLDNDIASDHSQLDQEHVSSILSGVSQLVTACDPGRKLTLHDLVDCPITVLPTPVFCAEAILISGQAHVVIHQGVFTALSFAVDSFAASAIKPKERECNLSAVRDYGEAINIFSVGLRYAYFATPFTLPVLRTYFPEEKRGAFFEWLLDAELFIILHEYGHVRLGHIQVDGSGSGLHEMSLDSSSLARDQERDADRFAVEHCPEFLRASVLSGAAFFLWLYGCHEAVMGRHSDHHPPAEVRINHLIEHFKGSTDTRVIDQMELLRDFLSSERATFSRFGEDIPLELRVRMFLRGLSPRRAVWLLQRAVQEVFAS